MPGPRTADDGSRRATVLKSLLAILVVGGIFFGVLPRVADMGEVWAHVRDLTAGEIAVVVGVNAWNLVTYWFVTIAALPRLSLAQAGVVNLSSTAVANTVPAGGGVGVAVTTAMLRSWGYTTADVGRYVVVTGIWNNFVKLGMPIVALALLAAAGGATASLVGVAVLGVIGLVVAVVVLGLMLRSEALARRIGAFGGKVGTWVKKLVRKPPVEDAADRAARFRDDSTELLATRWHWLTLATIVGHVALFLVLLVTLRVVGVGADQLTWIEALAGFAFARLLTAVPLTPGAVGMIELGYVGAFVTLGAERSLAVAAVLVFRAFTWLLPIPMGGLTYVVWRRNTDWQEDADDEADDAEDAAVAMA
jgi:putative heme transporter